MPTLINRTRRTGFTLIELLVVIAIIAILAACIMPAFSKAHERVQAISCLNNTHQLDLARQLYTDDHDNFLPYNLGMSGSFRTNVNWVNNVMSWDLSTDNTNPATISQASLGTYNGGNTAVYHCPSDQTLSSIQRNAGWSKRLRSYSLNAMIGNAGDFSTNGFNINNPNYKQFFKTTQIPRPVEIFTFLDEHPDSIGDGYFLNKSGAVNYGVSRYGKSEWTDLPASYHNGSTAFSFADGHASLHRWNDPSTIRPSQPHGVLLPLEVSATSRSDFDWVIEHMSIEK